VHRYWRAANYLCIGQIYLFENPLLREPLKAEQIKPRLLGHWGTSPGQNLIYIHLIRLINEHDADIIYIAGPGTAALRSMPTPISREGTGNICRCV
jgi:xylulose-5-phosphate/fructose-6-phosphate phosphoketolase